MRKLDEILEYNRSFVQNRDYVEFMTSKEPKKRILILSCMDTRLTELLPKAMNIENGDAKIVKNAGAAITHPFGSIMRSIIVAIYEFEVDEIMVVGHHGCGMCNLDTDNIVEKILHRGVPECAINTLNKAGIDVKKWLHGFDTVEESIRDSVNAIKNHPLMPKGVFVHGLVIDPKTGKLDVVVKGYSI